MLIKPSTRRILAAGSPSTWAVRTDSVTGTKISTAQIINRQTPPAACGRSARVWKCCLSVLRAERRVNRGKRSGWHHIGNNLPAMAAIDAEVGIGGKQERSGQCFGHANEARVGEAHGHIGIFLQQLQHGFQLIV